MITFVSTFPPIICGIGTYMRYNLEHVSPSQWRVISFKLDEFSASGEVMNHATKGKVDYCLSLPHPTLPTYCEKGLLWFQHAFGMWGNSNDHFLSLLEEAKRRGNKVVASFHTIHFQSEETPSGMAKREVDLLSKALPFLDGLSVFTDGAHRAVLKAFPGHGDKVAVLRHGVHLYPKVGRAEARKRLFSYLLNEAEMPLFQKRELAKVERDLQSEESILLGNFGFITADKDPLQLYEVGRLVQERLPGLRVITFFAGIIQRRKDKKLSAFAPIREALKAHHDGKQNFFLENYIPESIFPMAFRALDFAVFWCHNATQSGRMAHAQGSGTIVVGRDWEGIGETLRLSGLPAAESLTELSGMIVQIVREPGLREKMDKQNRAYSQRYSFYSQAQKHLVLAKAILEGGKLPQLDRSKAHDLHMGKIGDRRFGGFEETSKRDRLHSQRC
ncbi:MAG: hypothetical protein JRI71_09230 [Deltaproteobacteria bacterium]|nr:hypothetical protein [Deltaproteobacteria bacterium]MBW2077709.1 hypothetical protein [Deltaproteobacteria bacterium]MBW2312008.1 hypothetical protein [Deltaproteobacteria bacterium]